MLSPNQPLHFNVLWPYISISNVPISLELDFELEDLKYYSFAGTVNVEALGNENMSDLPNDCIACGHMYAFEDEESKANNFA